MTALGALFMLLGVALGAFGAHALRGRIAPDLIAVFETGARYHLIHALALIVVGLDLARRPSRALRAAGVLFAAGIVLFSGSLYALALTGVRVWGAVTPLGGARRLASSRTSNVHGRSRETGCVSVCFSTQMGTTPSRGSPGADASSIRPPGIRVAAK